MNKIITDKKTSKFTLMACMRIGIIVILAGLPACSTMKQANGSDSSSSDTAKEQGTTTQKILEDSYVIGADDVLHVMVEQHPELSGDYIVGPNGNIIIPTLGEVKAEGNSRKEFEKTFSNFLSKYINNPRVQITISKYNSNVIYVLGEVNVPGKYSTEGKNMTLRDVIVKAGLPTRFAATGRVFVISPSQQQRPATTVVDLYRILYLGDLKRNVVVQPGDIVFVPKNLFGRIYDFISVFLGPISAVRIPVVP